MKGRERVEEVTKLIHEFINDLKEIGISVRLVDGELKFDEKTGIDFSSKKVVLLTYEEDGKPMMIPFDYALESMFGNLKEEKNEEE